jgi:hypothetical protein
MNEHGEPPPLSRLFVVWAGDDISRWLQLTGCRVHYPPKGYGEVTNVEMADGTAYIYVRFDKESNHKFHALSMEGTIRLAALPSRVNPEEVRQTYEERWPLILRQREEAEQRLREWKEEEWQRLREAAQRQENERRRQREEERIQAEVRRAELQAEHQREVERQRAEKARRARIISIVNILRRDERPHLQHDPYIEELAQLLDRSGTEQRTWVFDHLPAWARALAPLLARMAILTPESQARLLGPALPFLELEAWGTLSTPTKILLIYQAAQASQVPDVLRNAAEERSDDHPLVGICLTLLPWRGNVKGEGASFNKAHKMLQEWIVNSGLLDDTYPTMTLLIPSCPEGLVRYCEGRPWRFNSDREEPGSRLSRAYCPRSRGPCSVVGPDDMPVGETYRRVGARLQAERSRHWSSWSLHELLEAGEIIPSLSELRSPDEYVPKLGGWINRLEEIWSRLRCSYCQFQMPPNFRYAKNLAVYNVTVFSCRIQDPRHDTGIYITHCWACTTIIDSRQNTIRCEDRYLCLKCGSGPQHSDSYTQGDICPKCGQRDMKESYRSSERICRIAACSHIIHLPPMHQLTGKGNLHETPTSHHLYTR